MISRTTSSWSALFTSTLIRSSPLSTVVSRLPSRTHCPFSVARERMTTPMPNCSASSASSPPGFHSASSRGRGSNR